MLRNIIRSESTPSIATSNNLIVIIGVEEDERCRHHEPTNDAVRDTNCLSRPVAKSCRAVDEYVLAVIVGTQTTPIHEQTITDVLVFLMYYLPYSNNPCIASITDSFQYPQGRWRFARRFA
jgi:hypothetical protein